jgi:Ca-activated chloride channel family protein
MRPVVTCSFLIACIFFWSFFASAHTFGDDSQPYTISTSVNLVVVPVTVTDHDHQFVSGLDASQFRVYEEGRPQTLSLFRPEDVPVTVGLVVDHSGSMDERKTDVVDGARAFVQTSNPQDEEFVINFSQEVVLGLGPNAPFTSSADELTAALSAVPASGMTALYDAIAVGLKQLRSAHNEKKVLILITDGDDNASHYFFDQVLQMARALDVLVYAVGLFDTDQIAKAQDPQVAREWEDLIDQHKNLLMQLAKETGGAAYFPSKSAHLIDVCKQIADDIRHQYTLAYTPRDDGRGGYRKIRVKVAASHQGKLSVRSRRGYLLPAKPKCIDCNVSRGSSGMGSGTSKAE